MNYFLFSQFIYSDCSITPLISQLSRIPSCGRQGRKVKKSRLYPLPSAFNFSLSTFSLLPDIPHLRCLLMIRDFYALDFAQGYCSRTFGTYEQINQTLKRDAPLPVASANGLRKSSHKKIRKYHPPFVA